jgi:hypothetical protein
MSDAALVILTKSVVTLLPLVPAFVLFRFLPSSGSVTGPFKGLEMKFGGAFAAYLAVLLVVWQGLDNAERHQYHVWTVTGTVGFQPGASAPNVNDVTSFVTPPELHVRPDGTFKFDIPVRENLNGEPALPTIVFDLNGYVPATVQLHAPDDVPPSWGGMALKQRYNRAARAIDVADPVVLRSAGAGPAYAPSVMARPAGAAPGHGE